MSESRPQNLKRSAFHALWGLFAVFLAVRYLNARELTLVSGAFTVTAWCLEGIKRSGVRGEALFERLFGAITHASERHKVNSATWYCSAVWASTLLFEPLAIVLSVLCLAVGDPMAGVIGRRYGRLKLLKGRSAEGTLSFVFSAALASRALLWLAHPEVEGAWGVALTCAVASALAELLSGDWLDDNLTIPLIGASAASWALG